MRGSVPQPTTRPGESPAGASRAVDSGAEEPAAAGGGAGERSQRFHGGSQSVPPPAGRGDADPILPTAEHSLGGSAIDTPRRGGRNRAVGPGLRGRGGGGPDSQPGQLRTILRQPPTVLSEADRNLIRQSHTQLPDSGIWVHGIKMWEARQAQEGTQHTAVPVPGDGNCFYWTLIEHFHRLGRTEPLLSAGPGELEVDWLKRCVDNYYFSDTFRDLRRRSDFNILFPHLTLNEALIPVEVAALEHHLTTPRAQTPLVVCQLAALAFGLDIHIQCLLEEGVQVLLGGIPSQPDTASRPTVLLLLREEGVPSYDRHFAPLDGCGGHFWYVNRPELLSLLGPSNDGMIAGGVSAGAPFPPTSSGNGGASALPRQ